MERISFHASCQLRERYGVLISDEKFVATINEGQPKFHKFGNGGTQEFEIVVRGKLVRYLTDSTKRMVITVLPPASADEADMDKAKVFRTNTKRRRQEFFRATEDTEDFETA
jgi:hypothetical protein